MINCIVDIWFRWNGLWWESTTFHVSHRQIDWC